MRLFRLLLVLLAVLWLAGELTVVPIAEGRIEQRVAELNRDAANVNANIDSFPLVSRLVFTGRVNEVTLTLERVARARLTFAEVRFALEGIEVDRATLLQRQPKVTAIDRGTITAVIDTGVLGNVASALRLNPRVRGRTLVVGLLSFPIPSDLVPCQPEVRVEDNDVIVSCTIDEVPEVLLDAAQGG
ncbi:MAG: LmeA family phospholipid-binding protein [Actinomycetota bacterium]